MAIVHYPAIVERAGDGFSVFFPDLAGCASAGATMQEAALGAEEALSGHLAVMAQYGDPVPEPSFLDVMGGDADVDEVARILVRGERPGRAIRVQVSIDEGLLARIDRIATNRSGFLAEAGARETGRHALIRAIRSPAMSDCPTCPQARYAVSRSYAGDHDGRRAGRGVPASA